tara:strand:+ start:736 stop:927 length:192 start_codon:yes stop_codon:yes gene_type:complete
MFSETAKDENIERVTINEKLNVVSGYIENTRKGSKNKNSEIVIKGIKSMKKIPIEIKMYDGFE